MEKSNLSAEKYQAYQRLVAAILKRKLGLHNSLCHPFIIDVGGEEVSLEEGMKMIFETLPTRGRWRKRDPFRILSLRFGLEDGKPRTLEQVGREYWVTRERIRQIEAKILRELRHPYRLKLLRRFLILTPEQQTEEARKEEEREKALIETEERFRTMIHELREALKNNTLEEFFRQHPVQMEEEFA